MHHSANTIKPSKDDENQLQDLLLTRSSNLTTSVFLSLKTISFLSSQSDQTTANQIIMPLNFLCFPLRSCQDQVRPTNYRRKWSTGLLQKEEKVKTEMRRSQSCNRLVVGKGQSCNSLAEGQESQLVSYRAIVTLINTSSIKSGRETLNILLDWTDSSVKEKAPLEVYLYTLVLDCNQFSFSNKERNFRILSPV